MLNRQVVFDAIARRAKDKRKALTVTMDSPEFCMYRDPVGLACFVGALIPDELYKPQMENQGDVYGLLRSHPKAPFADQFFTSGAPEILRPEDARFLKGLQEIHDFTQNTTEKWDGLLTRFAAENFLSPAVVLEAA